MTANEVELKGAPKATLTIDRALAADLKGVVDKARAEIRARMDAAATKAITDAATAAVKGL